MIQSPRNAKELYDMLILTNDLRGNIKLIDDYIIWTVNDKSTLNIGLNHEEGYVDVNDGLFHWHPECGNIYTDLISMMKSGNCYVIRNSLIFKQLYYSGPIAEYRFDKNKKWHWGKLYYFD